MSEPPSPNLDWKSAADAATHTLDEEYALSLNSLGDGIPVVLFAETEYADGGIRYHYVSSSIVNILGITPAQIYADGMCLLSRIHPEDMSDFQQAYLRARATLEPMLHDLRMFTASGEVRWLRDFCKPIPQPDGTVRWIGYFMDVHEEVFARKALEAAEQKLREITDRVPGAVYQMRREADGRMRFEFVSAGIRELAGFSPEEAEGDAAVMSALILPEDRHLVFDTLTSTAPGPVTMDFRARHRDGRVRWIHGLAERRFHSDGSMVSIGSWQDFTEYKDLQEGLARALDAAQQAEQRIREITEALPGVVYETQYHSRTGSRMAYVTDGAQALYGVPKEEILRDNTALTRLIPLEDRARMLKEAQQAFRQTGPVTQTFRIRKPDGELRWLRSHSTQRTMDDGLMRWIGFTVDVTDEKRVEQELAQAKLAAESANRAKSEFLANMSHEIRTPMNAILSFAYLGLRTEAPPKMREYFARIESSARTLLDLINDVLDLSKVEAGKLELEVAPFDLSQVLDHLESVVGLRAQEKGLAFRIEVDADVPKALSGDALRLGQVLMNLGGNAVKFTQAGEVVVRVGLAPPEAAAGEGDTVLQFSVRDTGIGLTREQMSRLFEAFEQADSSTAREFGGTGLGLSIAKRLVELMGGSIGVSSAPNKGSTFSFIARFGLAREGAVEPAVRSAGTEHLRGLSVLVTDDHDINRQVVKELLASVGVDVSLAASGPEAIEALEAQRFDAVFMDMRMPGMDGLEATRRIRGLEGRAHRTPIIALTANVMAPDRERCLTAGMDDFVGKPIAVDELFSTLARWTGRDAEPARFGESHSRVNPPADESHARDHDFDAARARFGRSPEIYEGLVLDFIEGDGLLDELRAELAAGRFDSAGIAAHTLKGLAAQVGALRVSRIAAGIEEALDAGSRSGFTLDELAQALDAARAALRSRAAPTQRSAVDLDRVPALAAEMARRLEADDDAAWDAFEALREILPEAEARAIAPVGKLIANLDHAEALALWRRMHAADAV